MGWAMLSLMPKPERSISCRVLLYISTQSEYTPKLSSIVVALEAMNSLMYRPMSSVDISSASYAAMPASLFSKPGLGFIAAQLPSLCLERVSPVSTAIRSALSTTLEVGSKSTASSSAFILKGACSSSEESPEHHTTMYSPL